VADAPARYTYKLLPPGAFGTPPRGVPDAAHRATGYALAVLQRDLDLGHGVTVRWFAAAGPQDRDGDPGLFASAHPLWGCVDPAAPTEARLNLALTRGPVARLLTTVVHEALHCEELSRGLDRRRTHAELEQLTQELTDLLCAGVA
jgi:hypothetical protein